MLTINNFNGSLSSPQLFSLTRLSITPAVYVCNQNILSFFFFFPPKSACRSSLNAPLEANDANRWQALVCGWHPHLIALSRRPYVKSALMRESSCFTSAVIWKWHDRTLVRAAPKSEPVINICHGWYGKSNLATSVPPFTNHKAH